MSLFLVLFILNFVILSLIWGTKFILLVGDLTNHHFAGSWYNWKGYAMYLISNNSKFLSFGTVVIQSGSKVIQMGSCLFQSIDTHSYTEVPTFWITHGCIVEIKAQSGHLKLIFGHLYGIRMNLFTFVNLILAFSTSIWLKQSINGKLVMKNF